LPDVDALRRQVHRALLDTAGDNQFGIDDVKATARRLAPLLDDSSLAALVVAVMADVNGMGLLEPLLADDQVSDVMVVGGRGVWIERAGMLADTGLVLTTVEVEHLIEKAVAPLGLRVDRSCPMLDARLADGSRINAIVAPLAVDGSCLTIRRFAAKPIPLVSIASEPVGRLLANAVRDKLNIVISGGTGSGKTTLLNALARQIGAEERVITIEDAAELRLPLRHVVRLESRVANSEGAGSVSLRQLLRNALRMRPDRIIVGEVRGPEALDMLQAMNTGHEGSMSTCHANSALDALSRLETMVLMGEVSLPLDAVRQQIAASVDLVVQIARTERGRRVVEVGEVTTDGEALTLRLLAIGEEVVGQPIRHRAQPRAVAAC